MNEFSVFSDGDDRRRTPGRRGPAVGTCSILMIFVVLCLVTFAVLSLVSAKADRALSEKNTGHVTAYYQAECDCYAQLAAADETLRGLSGLSAQDWPAACTKALTQAGWKSADGGEGDSLCFTLSRPVSDTGRLTVRLLALSPAGQAEAGVFYKLEGWQVETEGDWQPQESLPVYGANGALPQA